MKDLRESLGLSVEWVAEQTGMSANSIKNIESGAKKAPQSVMNFLKQIDAMIDNSVNQVVEQIVKAERLTGTLPEQLDLVRYNDDVDLWHYQPEFKPLPATCHAALINRLMDKISTYTYLSTWCGCVRTNTKLGLMDERIAKRCGLCGQVNKKYKIPQAYEASE